MVIKYKPQVFKIYKIKKPTINKEYEIQLEVPTVFTVSSTKEITPIKRGVEVINIYGDEKI